MIKKFQLAIFSFFLLVRVYSQSGDGQLINALLTDIAAMQVTGNGEFYAGTFPSYRECAGIPHNYQPDNNIFYTAISVFTLRNLLPHLEGINKEIASQIINNAQKAFPYYRDKNGDPYYSFWPTGKGILPHSLFMNKIKLVDMGQDVDDAVMCLMASDATIEDALAIKKRMTEVSNLSRKRINSTFRSYRGIPAYSTWLGYRMKPDFDLAVHCNVLYFMLEKNLPLVKQDSATIQLLTLQLKERKYIKAPVYISPFYVKPSILMYHLARLMARFNIKELNTYKPQLIADLQKELRKGNELMEMILLSTSLIRLGIKPSNIDIPDITTFENSGTRHFVFFQARAAFSYPTPFKQIFLHFSYMNYYFYCQAYNKVLWLEYLVERNK